MPDEGYPLLSFYFTLEIVGLPKASVDNAFQEVSGLTAEMETMEIREGGQNQYKYRVPTVAKYTNLVLKRGLMNAQSPLTEWCMSTVGADLSAPIVLHNVLLTLLSEAQQPLQKWTFIDAWPVKCSLSDFRAMKEAELAIETLELSYTRFEKVQTVAAARDYDAEEAKKKLNKK
ncbi:phage tail protein [Hymenobacter cellulosivorans]|uniref:Phage tail protein n=1 Tax=Hymenobacter cellulosivorans TaxID=2932249 RepID=A0ABY4FC89_9BACT|nr:phage tail protein [Hymenobacter cellulosivorans]UOQ52076.1 phage tail protein [Hymenobacter cellulosivorans]